MLVDVNCIHIFIEVPFGVPNIQHLVSYFTQHLCVYEETSFSRYVALYLGNLFLYCLQDVWIIELCRTLCMFLCIGASNLTKVGNTSLIPTMFVRPRLEDKVL